MIDIMQCFAKIHRFCEYPEAAVFLGYILRHDRMRSFRHIANRRYSTISCSLIMIDWWVGGFLFFSKMDYPYFL